MTCKLNANERAVLVELSAGYEERCAYFITLMQGTGLDRPSVRRACRSLARKGLARYERGLFTDDGEVAGSGYGITHAGMAAVQEPAP